ncbi:hypothetical protein [Amycolatopsis sp. NPDC051071]|uniref:hypothetical protein n=1 Tax=Amycolatopsis sp. NPDC051071 TaxID=3154637 RepID=UPI003430BA64
MIVKVLAVGACLVLAGCAGSSTRAPVEDATARFLGALASADYGSACTLLAPRIREAWNREGCEHALAEAAVPRGTPGTISVWGEEAQVKTSSDTLFLHEFSTGWLITGTGCRPRNEQVYDCAVGGP